MAIHHIYRHHWERKLSDVKAPDATCVRSIADYPELETTLFGPIDSVSGNGEGNSTQPPESPPLTREGWNSLGADIARLALVLAPDGVSHEELAEMAMKVARGEETMALHRREPRAYVLEAIHQLASSDNLQSDDQLDNPGADKTGDEPATREYIDTYRL
jgi:hypothetical protein